MHQKKIPSPFGHDSIFNCVGRITFGSFSDILLDRFGTPRPVFSILSSVMFACSCYIIAESYSGPLLYLACILGATAYGGLVSNMIVVVSDFFGPRYVSALAKNISFSAFIGSYVFATVLIGTLYDDEMKRQGGDRGDATCEGLDCFRTSMLILTVLNCLNIVLCVILIFISKHIYTRKWQRAQDEKIK